MTGTFPDPACGGAHAGLSKVSVDMSYGERGSDRLDFSYSSEDFSFEKHRRKENSQNEHSAIGLFYLGIIYVDKVPETDPHVCTKVTSAVTY